VKISYDKVLSNMILSVPFLEFHIFKAHENVSADLDDLNGFHIGHVN